jgi:hypothetical protein
MLMREGRQPNGFFAAGNSFSSGSGYATRLHEKRLLIQKETSDQDTIEVWRSIITDAKAGDAVARRLFCDYVLGRATQPIAVSASDDGSADQAATMERILAALQAFPDARYAVARVLYGDGPQPKAIESEFVQPTPDPST